MWLHPKWKCDHFQPEAQLYSLKHDAYYCRVCDEWIKEKCGAPNCQFCPERPDKPSEEKK